MLAWGGKGKGEKKEGEKRRNGETGKRGAEKMDGEKGASKAESRKQKEVQSENRDQRSGSREQG